MKVSFKQEQIEFVSIMLSIPEKKKGVKDKL
jgi:hypothetical protein